MQTSVTFKNFSPSDALKSYVEKKLDRFDKLLDSPVEASVVLSVEKIRHIAEVNLTSDRLNIQAREESSSMYSSIDKMIDKIKQQINKNKKKGRTQTLGSKESIKDRLFESSLPPLPETDNSSDVMVEQIEYKPMDIDEAILQMNIVKDHFIVFTNSRTDEVNVLYRRKGGHFGLIQPSS